MSPQGRFREYFSVVFVTSSTSVWVTPVVKLLAIRSHLGAGSVLGLNRPRPCCMVDLTVMLSHVTGVLLVVQSTSKVALSQLVATDKSIITVG